jgi:uncharacterized protein YjbI with pentapeptide repeats
MQRAALRGALAAARTAMVEEGARRRSIIQLHFAGKFLAFASKSIGLSSCVSQTRPMAAFGYSGRPPEAEPGAKAHLEGASLNGASLYGASLSDTQLVDALLDGAFSAKRRASLKRNSKPLGG